LLAILPSLNALAANTTRSNTRTRATCRSCRQVSVLVPPSTFDSTCAPFPCAYGRHCAFCEQTAANVGGGNSRCIKLYLPNRASDTCHNSRKNTWALYRSDRGHDEICLILSILSSYYKMRKQMINESRSANISHIIRRHILVFIRQTGYEHKLCEHPYVARIKLHHRQNSPNHATISVLYTQALA
jgi:hypothetical protein